LRDYLGGHVNKLLAILPFSEWDVKRATEEELPKKEVWYEFEGHGVEVICDEAERILTIFVHRGDAQGLSEIPFWLNRHGVRGACGPPDMSGAASHHPIIGDRGEWDRFVLGGVTVHVEYQVGVDAIEMVTLMLDPP
jgi:hypothetical protein